MRSHRIDDGAITLHGADTKRTRSLYPAAGYTLRALELEEMPAMLRRQSSGHLLLSGVIWMYRLSLVGSCWALSLLSLFGLRRIKSDHSFL
jgi:hypothetical protein